MNQMIACNGKLVTPSDNPLWVITQLCSSPQFSSVFQLIVLVFWPQFSCFGSLLLLIFNHSRQLFSV